MKVLTNMTTNFSPEMINFPGIKFLLCFAFQKKRTHLTEHHPPSLSIYLSTDSFLAACVSAVALISAFDVS